MEACSAISRECSSAARASFELRVSRLAAGKVCAPQRRGWDLASLISVSARTSVCALTCTRATRLSDTVSRSRRQNLNTAPEGDAARSSAQQAGAEVACQHQD